MAVTAQTLPLFCRVMQTVTAELAAQRVGGKRLKLLSLGYTDFVVTRDDVARSFGPAVAESCTIRPDSRAIAEWHKIATDSVIDGDSLFQAMGFEPHYLDVAEVRGGEIIQDLNEPLAPELVGGFDFVLDSGTLEHCFNVGQAVANIASAVRVGGVVHHGNPMLMINHGFYNFSPTFYVDFYGANGFDLIDMYSVQVKPDEVRLSPLDGFNRIKFGDPAEKVIHVIARKREHTPTVWPIQAKYRKTPSQSIQKAQA